LCVCRELAAFCFRFFFGQKKAWLTRGIGQEPDVSTLFRHLFSSRGKSMSFEFLYCRNQLWYGKDICFALFFVPVWRPLTIFVAKEFENFSSYSPLVVRACSAWVIISSAVSEVHGNHETGVSMALKVTPHLASHGEAPVFRRKLSCENKFRPREHSLRELLKKHLIIRL
jgi:hypothetical protein